MRAPVAVAAAALLAAAPTAGAAGLGWGAQQRVPGLPVGAPAPGARVTPSGDVVLTLALRGVAVDVAARPAATRRWRALRPVTPTEARAATSPTVVAAGDMALAVWTRGRTLYAASATAAGWAPPTAVPQAGTAPWHAAAGPGRGVVTWVSEACVPGTDVGGACEVQVLAAVTGAGGPLGPPAELARLPLTVGERHAGPRAVAAVAADGTAVAAWMAPADDGEGRALHLATLPPGAATWVPRGPVAGFPTGDVADAAAGPAGEVVVAVAEDEGRAAHAVTLDASGTVASVPIAVAGGGTSVGPSLASGPGGVMAALDVDERGGATAAWGAVPDTGSWRVTEGLALRLPDAPDLVRAVVPGPARHLVVERSTGPVTAVALTPAGPRAAALSRAPGRLGAVAAAGTTAVAVWRGCAMRAPRCRAVVLAAVRG